MLAHVASAVAQTDVFTSFNATHAGRNISVSASKLIKGKHEIGGGLRFNLNRLAHTDDQNNVYKKRLYATNFFQHLGLGFFYHRRVFRKWKKIEPLVFYDMQVTYAPTRNRMLLPFSYDVNGDVLYKEYIEFFGPFTWLEQNIGIGFKANLFSNFFIQQKVGFGTTFIMGFEKKLLSKYFNWFAWEFGALINVGIGYRFAKKKKEKGVK